MITSLIWVFIVILVICIIGAIAVAVVRKVGLAEPYGRWAELAIFVVCALSIILVLLGLIGEGPGLRLVR